MNLFGLHSALKTTGHIHGAVPLECHAKGTEYDTLFYHIIQTQ